MEFRTVAIAHMAFTLAMVGFMTTVQLVIYPQFRKVAELDFAAHVSSHGQGIVLPLLVFAPAEVLLGLLVWLRAPSGTERTVAFVAGLLLVVAWTATAVWYGPLHGRLANEPYDATRISQLISTNWVRTVIWGARGLLATWLVWLATT